MAKVLLPLLSQTASGKFGDIVFFERYGRNIVRRRVKPANPNTIAQQMVRWNLKSLSQAWKGSGDAVYQDDANGTVTEIPNANYVILKKYDVNASAWVDVPFIVLTDTEKQAWINYAKVVKGYGQFGRLLFIGTNAKALRQGNNPVRTP